MHSAWVVLIFFNTDFYRSVFSTYFLKKLFFRLSALYVFCPYDLEFNVIFEDFIENICVVIFYIGAKCSAILFSPKNLKIKLLVLTLYKLFVKT